MKALLSAIASSVRLGVLTLKLTSGVGVRVNDVNDDMVMAHEAGSERVVETPFEVQTTTECGRRRMMPRTCSGSGSAEPLEASGVGGVGADMRHEFKGADVWNCCTVVSMLC